MTDPTSPPPDVLDTYYAQRTALEAEGRQLELDFEDARRDLELRLVLLESEHAHEVKAMLEKGPGVWTHPDGGQLTLREYPTRVRVHDETVLIDWLSEHLPELVQVRAWSTQVTRRLRPLEGGVFDRDTGNTYPLPPGVEVVPAYTRLIFESAFTKGEDEG